MDDNTRALRLRIYISSTDKLKSSLLFESIVYQAKRFGLAGATVLKGIMGFGSSSIIHSYKFWEISEKVPVVIELVDKEEKVLRFYETIKPYLQKIRYGCLVTSEPVNLLMYKTGRER